jgi:hypothetical protein
LPGILAAGAEGTVQLVGVTVGATISGTCSVAREGNWDVVTGNLRETMNISGEMLNGSVSLYVEYPSFKWCKAWGIPYPCGFQISRPTEDLCSWGGITVGPWTLYDRHQDGFKINRTCAHPNTCAVGVCGTIDNGCGGTVDCGGCGDSEHTCGNNTCQCSTTCPNGWACAGSTSACGASLNCPTCPADQYCDDHTCHDCSGTTPSNYGVACGSPCGAGTIDCKGNCTKPNPEHYGEECGKYLPGSQCGGTIKCDGTCSVSTPFNYGSSCGSCGGTVKCDGTCSSTPSNYGTPCGTCGTITCDGTCREATPSNYGELCLYSCCPGYDSYSTIGCDGQCTELDCSWACCLPCI